MNILMGIGNEINGDDAAGVFIAKRFSANGWKSINCETVPENFIGVIKRDKPEILVLVDATEMGLEPGDIRLIQKSRLNSEVDSTHSLSLHFLVSELEKYSGKIIFIGIQPKSMSIGDEMSSEVVSSTEKLMEILKKSDFSRIKTL